MPLAAIRRYAELVRRGPGNETDRLAILRQHQGQVTAQLAALTACLEVITFKVKLYEESLADGTPDPIWAPPSGATAQAPPAEPAVPASRA
jgi:hypothetical protein